MGRRIQIDGVVTDTRTLPEAKVDAAERVLATLAGELAKLDESPMREAAQWLAIGLLAANPGQAVSAWPLPQRTLWTNQVQPQLDAIAALHTRLRTARQAITAATTREQADAVTL